VAAAIARLSPGELLMSERILNQPALMETLPSGSAPSRRCPRPASTAIMAGALETFYGVAVLDGFGSFSRAELAAVRRPGRLCRTDPEGQIAPPVALGRLAEGALMEIDAGDAAQSRN